MTRRFYKRLFLVTVLTEDAPMEGGLGHITHEMAQGDAVGNCVELATEEHTEDTIATEVDKVGSDGTFFDRGDERGWGEPPIEENRVPQEPEEVRRSLERVAIIKRAYDNEDSDATDILTDLLHWCESPDNGTGQDFEDHLRLARAHHRAER